MAQGVGKTFKGMDTIFYVDYNKIPSEHHKRIKYGRIVVDYWPQKEETNCTRLTVEGNIIEYPGDAITPTYDTTISKIVWNIFVTTPKAKYICIGTF